MKNKCCNKKFARSILTLIFGILGLFIVGYFSHPMVSLGLFIFSWGDNLQMRDNLLDTLNS